MSSSVLVIIVMAYMIYESYAAGVLFSTTPQSRNVSAGTMVEFTCAVSASGLTSLGITTTSPVGSSDTDDNILPNGDRQVTLSFIASSDQTSINIVCVAGTTDDFFSSSAVLMIQGPLSAVGNLTSTEVDHCTLHFTWTAPYTLQGVPINYYTINITRHSDGAVLRSDTTNTTEYLYSVSSLGETLEVVVAAVNGVGTGNATSIIIQSPSSIREIEFNSSLKNNYTMRSDSSTNTNWTYTFDFEETFVCGGAISHVTVEACLNSSCTSTNGTVNMLPNGGRRVMAKFTDLMENRNNYTATLNINYNGGVVQQSQPVEISTFDVRSATLNGPVMNGKVCLDVSYVEGHVQPARCYILFKCSTNGSDMRSSGTINQTENCMNVVPHPVSYTILVTDNDGDAVKEINNVAPVTITGVVVPISTAATASATQTSSNAATPSPQSNDSGTITIVSTVVVIIAVLVVVATASSIILIYWINSNNKVKHTTKKNQSNFQLSEEGHQSNYEQEQRTQVDVEIIYSQPDHSQVAPRPAQPVGSVEYSDPKELMSVREKQCIDQLADMNNLQLDYSTSYKLLQPLALQWKEFGEALFLAKYLDTIKKNNSSDEERLQAVLACWEEKRMRPYTWETLDKVLRSKEVGANNLADTISMLRSSEVEASNTVSTLM